ncbi:ATP-binding protein [Synoicihabitans lomoniglobus]|uniref:histidine kinase n=1 Tax=Synoicihabitans lomoniglobus TaxID=2909285 RepID=A0AAF0CHU7_9BACT|nr:ATP-binding protein [Opitutaceae bacterium LMO-M01]WED64697.1 ATP-binding protein [Opitutaceae bacterium LMO-M01]
MTALRRLTQSIATWHRGIVFAAGILLLVALAVGLYTSRSTAMRMQRVNHSHAVLAQIDRAVALLRNAESEQRGFLITSSEGYEKAAEQYAEELDEALEDLIILVAENPLQSRRARNLRDAIYERLTELRGTAQFMRRGSIRDLREMLGDESELRVMARIREIHSAMTAAEQTLLAQRSSEMKTELQVATLTVLSSGGLALILGGQAFFLLRRSLRSLEREAELLREKESAESADREKSEFLANMSHEIRTPMNAVLGFAELLSGAVTTPKQRHYVDAINSSGRAMLSLINDILDLSKIEAGKLELNYRPISVERLLDEIRQVFCPQAEARGLKIVITVDPSLPPSLLFDQTRLRQILFNIVGNALKFTEQGQITVHASCRLCTSDETKVTLFLTVADTGIGISPEHQTAIFEPFRQVDDGPARGHGGTGLGLSITKRLTTLLNGQVELESIEGQGTTFRFAFPQVAISAAAPAMESSDSSAENFDQLKPSVILVADDVTLNRDLVAGFLENSRHRVVHAANGEEALNQAHIHDPDLILLDIRMPVMDGREALSKLRQDPDLQDVPVVSVTASSMLDEEEELRAHFDGYIRKPFTSAHLFKEMSRLLPPDEQQAAAAPEPTPELTEPPPAPGPEWPALLAYLQALEEGRWRALSKSMGARETAAFAHDLINRGEAAACPAVMAYGQKLTEQVERFQVSAMESTLQHFPQLVSGLSEQMASAK